MSCEADKCESCGNSVYPNEKLCEHCEGPELTQAKELLAEAEEIMKMFCNGFDHHMDSCAPGEEWLKKYKAMK